MEKRCNYTLRTTSTLLEKLGYIAAYEGRSKAKEIEQLILRRITEFEKDHGKIELSDK